MRPDLYWIDGSECCRLAIAPRPRGGEWLEEEMAGWQQAGVDVVVSLLTDAELSELDLELEQEQVEAHGMTFMRLPIDDRGVPDSREQALQLIDSLVNLMAAGQTVCVHCRMGIGRSALICAGILTRLGLDAKQAFQRIGIARGMKVPDTPEQAQWVRDL